MEIELLAILANGWQYHVLLKPTYMLILLKNLTMEDFSLFKAWVLFLFFNTIMVSIQMTNSLLCVAIAGSATPRLSVWELLGVVSGGKQG